MKILNYENEFKLNNGERLSALQLAYQTYGRLNKDKSNAILICHSLSSDANVSSESNKENKGWWDIMVGKDKPIDTNKYFVICINNLGGCNGSTGSSSINPETKERYGKHFPAISINDIVRSQKIVIEHLGIHTLHAVIGCSMGGMIALEWSLVNSHQVKHFVSVSSCGKAPASVIAAHHIQREIINQHHCCKSDSKDVCETCRDVFVLARKVGLLTYKSTVDLNERFDCDSHDVISYLNYNSLKFIDHFDKYSYLTFFDAMDSYVPCYDNLKNNSIKSLVISVSSDVLFPPETQTDLYRSLQVQAKNTQLIEHHSPHGHDAFYKDQTIGKYIADFLADENPKQTRIDGGIINVIGNTPLIALDKIKEHYSLNFNLYGKLEFMNPGGSIKDRSAKQILLAAFKKGEVQKDTVIIEYSSGNMGIGLSQICNYLGLSFICLVDPKTTEATIKIMQSYGTKIMHITQPDPKTNEFLPVALENIKLLLQRIPNSYWINQHGNLDNPAAHFYTFKEIHQTLKKVDYLFCATSTCGTIRGCAEYIKSNNLTTKIIAVDAFGSSIFSSHRAKRLIPGHGAGLVPGILKRELIDEVLFTTAEQAVNGAKMLLKHESIFAGGSSGAILSAILGYRSFIQPDSNCVMIVADRGERYLDSIYSDDWCEKNLNFDKKESAGNEKFFTYS